MILLFSRQDDGSTREVAEWLCSLKKDFIRINSDDNKNLFLKCDVKSMTFSIMINDKKYTFYPNDIKSVWNRRSGFSKEGMAIEGESLQKVFHKKTSFTKSHLAEEATTLFEFIHYILQANPRIQKIGNQFFNSVNKMIVLSIAKGIGLNIPSSYIITSKKELKALLKKEQGLITKALNIGVYRFSDNYGYYSYTEKITTDMVNYLPDTFFPSLVQGEIKKEFELRIFYLKEKFYSMAIFSGEFSETSIDSRKVFATQYTPRNVPYNLPIEIEKKLSLLMKRLKLNSGSIDMIVTPGKQYFFLEVNPVGQFGMVSKPCNYYLEKKIAQTL